MTSLVEPEKIEEIVGTYRRTTLHIGRAVSAEETIYILHSKQCVLATKDLRTCAFSRALDRGINTERWQGWVDKPVVLRIVRNRLAPKQTAR